MTTFGQITYAQALVQKKPVNPSTEKPKPRLVSPSTEEPKQRPVSLSTEEPKQRPDSPLTEEPKSRPHTIGWLNRELVFNDGDRWKLKEALSEVKYHEGEPPFEGRQVFLAECIVDPKDAYVDAKEAVIKIKYQVHGSSRARFVFFDHLEETKRMLKYCQPEDQVRLEENLAHAEALHTMAKDPVLDPHPYTHREVEALRYLGQMNCSHTPHFIDGYREHTPDWVDEQAMEGGYTTYILMTKVPGKQLDWDMYWWQWDEEMRNKFRSAFKEAMIALFKCGINPQDRAWRNLLWDEKEQKCYIVDFEDYSVLTPEWSGERSWSDDEYKYSRLSEDCKPHPDARYL